MRLHGVAAAIFVLLTVNRPCAAQEIRATVTGRVTDPQGAVLPGATVTSTNVDTNVSLDTVTDVNGGYTISQLQPGPYKLTATLQGFKTFIREGVTLHTAETAKVDMQLSLGALEESITVVAALSTVETDQSTLAQTMENKRVSELPLNGRQVYQLLQLTSGTQFTQTTFGSTGFSGTRAWDTTGNISIHGSRTGNNEFLIDGASNAATGGWQYAPPVDAIQEFKVQTASVDASYGRTSGGVVNMTLRSGTNTLHGSGFTFYRGDALDANSTQNNRNGIPNRDHRFVDGGGVLGGPIRQDRTFFMGAYQGFNENIPFPRTSTVPTDLQRLGDFSQTFTSAGQLITIFDPLTTRPDPSRPGRFIRDPFPGNRIPAARLNPVALALLGSIPAANVAGESSTQANNLAASPNLGLYRYNSYLARVDHVFSDRHRIFVTNSGNWGVEFRNQNGFPIPSLRGNWPKHRNHYLAAADDVYAVSPTTLVNMRVSFDRFNDFNPITYASLTGDLGIRTPFQSVAPQYPYIMIDGYQDFFPGTFSRTLNSIVSAQASLSKTRGSHFIKVGGDVRTYLLDRVSLGDANGRFDFSRGFTQRDPQSGDPLSGNAFASFLLGYPSGGGVDINAVSSRRYPYYALFVQDDWKPTGRLTINLGLRWDYQAPVTEADNLMTVGFDGTSANPFQVPGLALNGGLLFAGVDGHSNRPYKPDYKNFQPRVGASYKLRERIIVRANYGRSYLPVTGAGAEGINQTGFSRRTSIISSVQTGVPFNTFDRPYPDGLLQPFNSSLGLATNIGSGISFLNPDFKIPYVDQWMTGVSLELPAKVGVELAYVGNRSRRLPINGLAINEVSRANREKAIEALGGNASYLTELLPNPFAGLVPGTALNNPTVQRGQLLRPYPQFQGITMDRVNAGAAQYDGLETSVNRRLSQGLLAVVSYTYSRQYEEGVNSAGATTTTTSPSTNAGYLNNGFDTAPWRSISGVDRPHRFTVTALYDLPFGQGRLIGRDLTGLINTIVSGWQVNVIGEVQSGTPTVAPNAVLLSPSAALPAGEQSIDRWFDNSTVANPRPDGSYAWAVLPPNAFRTLTVRLPDVRDPSAAQWAFSVFKNMRLTDRVSAQFRAEMFNAFNTPIYGAPDVGVNSPRFGRVTPDQINFPRQTQLGLRLVF
jgi:outer membrane receptor protein involved in Fe transport